MKITKPIILVLLTASVFVWPVVEAAAEKTKSPPKFTALDNDKDNKLKPEEFKVATDAGVMFKFAKLDKNKDGLLSKAEYSIIMGDEECE